MPTLQRFDRQACHAIVVTPSPNRQAVAKAGSWNAPGTLARVADMKRNERFA
ncbi:MAG: hypothetical protein Q7S40_08025 [Opitutaceae bacterium]|nr:hypothetical protein [Opitutaceae bacterium]